MALAKGEARARSAERAAPAPAPPGAKVPGIAVADNIIEASGDNKPVAQQPTSRGV